MEVTADVAYKRYYLIVYERYGDFAVCQCVTLRINRDVKLYCTYLSLQECKTE